VRALGQAAVTLANAEGLSGHAAAVDLRISRAEGGGPGRA
jgi:histidinol dehydrogenase